MAQQQKAYVRAGVDIALADRLLNRAKPALKQATRPEVVGGIGAFGGLFDISRLKHRHPVLASSTDSVGTKLKVATLAGRHDGVGRDIVNHCMNDIAVMGAEPLYFLDYFACNKLDSAVYPAVLRSVARACRDGNCALLGGETCELPGVYAEGEYDLVGTVTGCVDKPRIVSGRAIRAGDLILGVASNGLHTNGYSLARRIVFETLAMSAGDPVPGTRTAVGAALLKPHLNYATALVDLFRTCNTGRRADVRRGNAIFGAAHITGGGLTGNLPRVLPEGLSAEIDTGSWTVPPLFRFLAREGKVDFEECYEVWNMGIGLALVLDPGSADSVIRRLRRHRHRARVIGIVRKGGAGVVL